jgi:predicted  nucleic acid-binding Zn-ribbon protein
MTETSGSKGDGTEELERDLEHWRARIDELRVQIDLGSKDAKEGLADRLERVENAYLAAKSRLAEARADASANLASVREAVDALVHDLHLAYDDAKEAYRRGSGEGHA